MMSAAVISPDWLLPNALRGPLGGLGTGSAPFFVDRAGSGLEGVAHALLYPFALDAGNLGHLLWRATSWEVEASLAYTIPGDGNAAEAFSWDWAEGVMSYRYRSWDVFGEPVYDVTLTQNMATTWAHRMIEHQGFAVGEYTTAPDPQTLAAEDHVASTLRTRTTTQVDLTRRLLGLEEAGGVAPIAPWLSGGSASGPGVALQWDGAIVDVIGSMGGGYGGPIETTEYLPFPGLSAGFQLDAHPIALDVDGLIYPCAGHSTFRRDIEHGALLAVGEPGSRIFAGLRDVSALIAGSLQATSAGGFTLARGATTLAAADLLISANQAITVASASFTITCDP